VSSILALVCGIWAIVIIIRAAERAAMPDQEQYRGDREAMSRLLDNLDDTWLGERQQRVIRRPAKA
jgi:hypothetical protein